MLYEDITRTVPTTEEHEEVGTVERAHRDILDGIRTVLARFDTEQWPLARDCGGPPVAPADWNTMTVAALSSPARFTAAHEGCPEGCSVSDYVHLNELIKLGGCFSSVPNVSVSVKQIEFG